MKPVYIRILAISLIIVVPVFFLLVFKPLGEIKRPVPPHKLYPQGLAEFTDGIGNKFTDTAYLVVPNKILTSQEGKPFVLDSLRGTVYVADFFFATCPGICPVMTKQLKRVQDAFIKDHNFKIVSFSVDPAKDTVEALRQYAKNNGAVPGKWFFLRGEKADIYSLAADGFKVIVKDGNSPEEAFIHSDKLTLVDADGNLRGYYDGTDSADVNRLMGDIVLVLRDYEKNYSFRKNPKERGKL